MSGRNGALDICRSLAIVLVVNCHIASSFAGDGSFSVVQLGGKGVDLFFVLSGWLLGYQLCYELRSTGKLDVRRFWFRRWLRTLPAYYAVLAITFAQHILIKHNSVIDYRYLFFLQNYGPVMPYFGVSWSLCVEEHFYLFVAPLLLLAFRSKVARRLLIVLIFLPFACRSLGLYGSLIETHTRYDQCAIGVALAAISVFSPNVWLFLCRLAVPIFMLGIAVIGLNVWRRLHPGNGGDLDCLPWALAFATFVLLSNSSMYFKYRCRFCITEYIANRAYSLYLLHIEAIVLIKRLPDLPLSIKWTMAWMFSVVLAEILYRYVEKPLMKSRERFPWSSRHPPSKSTRLCSSDEPSHV